MNSAVPSSGSLVAEEIDLASACVAAYEAGLALPEAAAVRRGLDAIGAVAELVTGMPRETIERARALALPLRAVLAAAEDDAEQEYWIRRTLAPLPFGSRDAALMRRLGLRGVDLEGLARLTSDAAAPLAARRHAAVLQVHALWLGGSPREGLERARRLLADGDLWGDAETPRVALVWEATSAEALAVRRLDPILAALSAKSPLRTTERLLQGRLWLHATGAASARALPDVETIRREGEGLPRGSEVHALARLVRALDETPPLRQAAALEDLLCVRALAAEAPSAAARVLGAAAVCHRVRRCRVATLESVAHQAYRAASREASGGATDDALALGSWVEAAGAPNASLLARSLAFGGFLLAIRSVRATETNSAAADPAADRLARRLVGLHGPLQKLGQVLAAIPGLLPSELVDALMRAALTSGRTLSPEAARNSFKQATGLGVEEAFAAFDDAPFANASIGQVHRAAARDGMQVCVKIQHPHVRKAFKTDLRVLRLASPFFTKLFGSAGGHAVAGELERLLLMECDYSREATVQRHMHEVFRGDARIRIGAVHDATTALGVLTTEFMPGTSFREFAATAPEPERARLAKALFRFYVESSFRHGILHTDPHPDNLLVDEGGRVVVLDFGASTIYEPSMREAVRDLAVAGARGERARHHEALAEAFRLCDEAIPRKFDFDAFYDMVRDSFLMPVLAPTFFFDGAFVKRAARLLTLDNPNRGVRAFPTAFVSFGRLVFGAYGLLASLCVEADFRGEFEAATTGSVTPNL